MTKHRDLFSPRELTALITFSNLISEARKHLLQDALAAGMDNDDVRLAQNGHGAAAYADAVATYLACAVSRSAD